MKTGALAHILATDKHSCAVSVLALSHFLLPTACGGRSGDEGAPAEAAAAEVQDGDVGANALLGVPGPGETYSIPTAYEKFPNTLAETPKGTLVYARLIKATVVTWPGTGLLSSTSALRFKGRTQEFAVEQIKTVGGTDAVGKATAFVGERGLCWLLVDPWTDTLIEGTKEVLLGPEQESRERCNYVLSNTGKANYADRWQGLEGAKVGDEFLWRVTQGQCTDACPYPPGHWLIRLSLRVDSGMVDLTPFRLETTKLRPLAEVMAALDPTQAGAP